MDEGFFRDTLSAIGTSEATKKNAMEIIRNLHHHDPHNLTKFEFSFKIKEGKITDYARYLNMDPDGYSCRGPEMFTKRLKLFREIVSNKGFQNNRVFSALEELKRSPMDLYFGFDVKDDDFLFSFWLIFGGVKRSGEVNFWPYDFNKIIHGFFNTVDARLPRIRESDVMNLGLDIGMGTEAYKLYYLCRDRFVPDCSFSGLMKQINKNLKGLEYFYFFSEMYDRDATLTKEKIFLEFLEDMKNGESNTENMIRSLSAIPGLNLDVPGLSTVLSACGGRISLISFEADGTLTFYIRPD